MRVKQALVIHPWFTVMGGGELLCLHTCKALQDAGYEVSLVADEFNPDAVERIYGMGDVLKACKWIRVEPFRPFSPRIKQFRFFAVQRLFYNRRIRNAIRNLPGDVVFSTQSSVFTISGRPVYHFLYSITDLFAYPAILSRELVRYRLGGGGKIGKKLMLYYYFLTGLRNLLIGDPRPELFFALSENVRRELLSRGYSNAVTIYPPARMDFVPREKKLQVVTVSRIVPQKRLEMFLAVARRLPQYQFYIVGRDTPELRRLNVGYSEKIMGSMPSNVHYIEAPIKEVPGYLEESKVYLYCGVEPGIGIAMMEACGAGCVPVAPCVGGGAEVVFALNEGLTFPPDDVGEAARAIELAMAFTVAPASIRERVVGLFSAEAFRDRVRSLLP